MIRLLLAIVVLATFGTSAFAGDPKRAAVHNKQAKAYFDAKQYDEAIVEFKKAHELDPKSITLFKIASAYYAKGDYKSAIEHYQNYLTADPDGPFAAQAIEFSTIANTAIADEAAKQTAEKETARRDAARFAATARIKQAEAYAQANAWASAAQEYTAAAEVGGDPAHLLEAAEAFRNVPDDVKARTAYLAYLDKVSQGPRSDEIRGKVAQLTRALEKAEADERERASKVTASIGKPVDGSAHVAVLPPAPGPRRGLVEVGLKAGLALSFLGTLPSNWQATGVEQSYERGGFAVAASGSFAFTSWLSVQTELMFARRSYGIEDCGLPTGCSSLGPAIQVDSVEVPVLARFDVGLGRWRIGLVAGLVGSLVIGHNVKDVRDTSTIPRDLTGSPLQKGVIGGLALRYRGVTFDGRYMKGFSKLADNLDATASGFLLLVGYAPLAR